MGGADCDSYRPKNVPQGWTKRCCDTRKKALARKLITDGRTIREGAAPDAIPESALDCG